MVYEEYVEDLLTQWGLKAVESTIKLHYHGSCFSRLIGSTVKSATISDADYYMVDRIISNLTRESLALATVAGYIYILRYPYSEIARLSKRSKATISNYRKEIVAYVAESINTLDN